MVDNPVARNVCQEAQEKMADLINHIFESPHADNNNGNECPGKMAEQPQSVK